MKPSPNPAMAGALQRYEALIATNPKVECKGATMPYTSCNGHMFSFLTASGKLALRLPEEERTAFLKAHKARLCQQHGTILKEYVEVPEPLFARPQALQEFFEASYRYVASLKPKPTPRKKKS